MGRLEVQPFARREVRFETASVSSASSWSGYGAASSAALTPTQHYFNGKKLPPLLAFGGPKPLAAPAPAPAAPAEPRGARDERRLGERRTYFEEAVAADDETAGAAAAKGGVLARMVHADAAMSPTYKEELSAAGDRFRDEGLRVRTRRARAAALRSKFKSAGRAAIASAMLGLGIGATFEAHDDGLSEKARAARNKLTFGEDDAPEDAKSPSPVKQSRKRSVDESRKLAASFVARTREPVAAPSGRERQVLEERAADEASAVASMKLCGEWQRLDGLRARRDAYLPLDKVDRAILDRLEAKYEGQIFALQRARAAAASVDRERSKETRLANMLAAEDEAAHLARARRDAALKAPFLATKRSLSRLVGSASAIMVPPVGRRSTKPAPKIIRVASRGPESDD